MNYFKNHLVSEYKISNLYNLSTCSLYKVLVLLYKIYSSIQFSLVETKLFPALDHRDLTFGLLMNCCVEAPNSIFIQWAVLRYQNEV